MKWKLIASVAMLSLAGTAHAACPAITMADMQGVSPGAFPQQYELAEFLHIILSFRNGKKVIARQLSHLACKAGTAIDEQDLRLTIPTGIE